MYTYVYIHIHTYTDMGWELTHWLSAGCLHIFKFWVLQIKGGHTLPVTSESVRRVAGRSRPTRRSESLRLADLTRNESWSEVAWTSLPVSIGLSSSGRSRSNLIESSSRSWPATIEAVQPLRPRRFKFKFTLSRQPRLPVHQQTGHYLFYLWKFELTYVTYVTYNLLMIYLWTSIPCFRHSYLWFTYDLLILLMIYLWISSSLILLIIYL